MASYFSKVDLHQTQSGHTDTAVHMPARVSPHKAKDYKASFAATIIDVILEVDARLRATIVTLMKRSPTRTTNSPSSAPMSRTDQGWQSGDLGELVTLRSAGPPDRRTALTSATVLVSTNEQGDRRRRAEALSEILRLCANGFHRARGIYRQMTVRPWCGRSRKNLCAFGSLSPVRGISNWTVRLRCSWLQTRTSSATRSARSVSASL